MRPLYFHACDSGSGPTPAASDCGGGEPRDPGSFGTGSGGPCPETTDAAPRHANRLTMLVSSADWRTPGIAEQLPRLLQPMGIHCVAAGSGEEAQNVIRSVRVHIAVIDLAIPLHAPRRPDGTIDTQAEARHAAVRNAQVAAGARLLQLLRRLDAPPPTIVIRPAQPSLRDSARGLSEALREGAFAVLDRPLHLEAMLEALRRIVARHYAHAWPGSSAPKASPHAPRRYRV